MSNVLSVTFLVISLFADSAAGQSTLVPIVDLRTGGLFGGVQNGKWITAAKTVPLIKPKMEFVLVGWNGVEEGGVSLADFNGESEACGEHWSFRFELEQNEGVGLGTNAAWNPAPRKARKVAATQAYRTAVNNFLRSKGFRRPAAAVKQVYIVDLDGDGVDEALISATRYARGIMEGQSIGDYSFTLLRAVKGKGAVSHLLQGEFFAARAPKNHWPPNVYELSGVVDLNGDGRMEIILSSHYYEGGSNSVFEYRNGKPMEIKELSIECGL